MDLKTAHREIVGPGLAFLPAKFDTREARLMMLAIGWQESGFANRVQLPRNAGGPPGPARGFWQFERGGGVTGVLEHAASRDLARAACKTFGIVAEPRPAWSALAISDSLACVFARLLLYTDPHPLPEIGDEEGAWQYYLRNWRPGAPHRDRWSRGYPMAVAALGG